MSEATLLRISMLATGLASLMGILWGMIAGSGMILFDGLYSLVSLFLSSLSLWTYREVQKSESDVFPFGRAQFEPLFVAAKSIVILGMCLYAGGDALSSLFQGGRELQSESALGYALFSVLLCVGMTLFLGQQQRIKASSLLQSEQNQWLGDALLSCAVLVGFLIAWLWLEPRYPALLPYVDPLMVLISSLVFIILPAKSLSQAGRELLFLRVDPDRLAPLDAEAKRIAQELEAEVKLHVISMGRQVELEANFLLSRPVMDVSEMDDIRSAFQHVAEQEFERSWINVNFTAKPSEL